MISQADARNHYTAGQAARKSGQRIEDAMIDHFGWYSDWSAMACFKLGYNDRPFEVRTWERYREINTDEAGNVIPSYNRMDDTLERGVSVIYPEWANTTSGTFYIANAENKGYRKITVDGIDTGYKGGDGEPLVIPVEA